MCGIAGILEFGRDARANASALRDMCSIITHRGPDDDGLYTDGSLGIGMRRLSIVDVAGGHSRFRTKMDLCGSYSMGRSTTTWRCASN